jgi:serine/threonine-protein kinase
VLPRELAQSPERLERFEREARTLAAVDHPNIVTIHSVEEAAGVRFLTMAYVEGRTLGELIPRRGLPVDQCLKLAVALTDGLRAAHERGIVHRDLKPGNVMVEGAGRLRILDFGLAKLQAPATSSISSQLETGTMSPAMTREGSILGTYPYMSPEQAEGKPTDARSDLFSFGVVLYEMATGERPFKGGSPAALISSILKDRPRPLGELRTDLPARLSEIVERCLEKDAADRFPSAAAVHQALSDLEREVLSGDAALLTHRPATRTTAMRTAALAAALLVAVVLAGLWLRRVEPPPGGGGSRIASLAVLPLRNLSGDPEQEYFADGMTEALITDLSKIGALRVISRSSAMRYKGTDKPLADIARELRADALVEGSVVREGNRVGITAQLIEAASDRTLWAERFERDLRGILKLQGEIARAVARQVEATLTPEEHARLTNVREIDPDAYEAYLKGSFHLKKLTPEGIEKGLVYLNEAVEKDPGSPLTHAGLALGFSLAASHSRSPPRDAFQKAQAAYRKALELDDTIAEAHAALAETKLYREWDWEGAERAFRRAIELDPSLARSHVHYAWYLNLVGRQDEAVAEMKRARQLDPLDPLWAAWLGFIHWNAGEYEEALVSAREALELDPGDARAFRTLGLALAGKGSYQEAIAAQEEAADRDPALRDGLAAAYARAGRRDQARQIATEMERAGDRADAYALARVWVALGDREQALRWIETAIERRHPFAPWAFRGLDFDQLLGDDPRYLALRTRVGLEPPGPTS